MPNPSQGQGSPKPYIVDDNTGDGNNYGNAVNEDLSNLWTDNNDNSSTNNPKNYQTKTCKLVVKYYANGGTGDPPSDSIQTYSGAKKPVTFTHTVNSKPSGLTRTGYEFLGWSTNSHASLPNYDPGDVITKEWTDSQSGTVSYNLYAVWVNSGVFIYEPGKKANETQNKFSVKPSLGETVNLRGQIFTRTGYTQNGWLTEDIDYYSPYITYSANDLCIHEGFLYKCISDISESESWTSSHWLQINFGDNTVNRYDLNASYTVLSDEVVKLYPEWSPNTYTVLYKPNEGDGSDTSVSVVYDTEITISYDIFTKEGYYIEYWNEASDGTKSSWYPGKTYFYQRDEDVTLYAYWSGRKYYVLYDDGTNGDRTPAVLGIIYTNLELDENDILYSSSHDLHKDSNDMLYITYPSTMVYVLDEEDSSYYSVAVYGSPFYTDRRPISKYGYSFNGWEANDGTILTKQNAWLDSYSFGEDPIWTRQEDYILKPVWSDNYPYGRMFFGEKDSSDFGIIIEKPADYYWPEYSYDHKKVNGRNGNILVSNAKYENVQRSYEIAVCGNNGFYEAASKLSNFLHRYHGKGYVRLEDSYEPDVYMMGIYEESGNVNNLLSEAGRATIKFNCKPQKFLISGNREIQVSKSDFKIINPTDFSSCPIIKIKGSGTINISGVDLVVIENFNGIILDCESCDAVDNFGRNMNYYVGFLDLIRLHPGENLITYDGYIESISIIPRWWKI